MREYINYLNHFESDLSLRLIRNLKHYTLKDIETLMMISTANNVNDAKRRKKALEAKLRENEIRQLERLKRSKI